MLILLTAALFMAPGPARLNFAAFPPPGPAVSFAPFPAVRAQHRPTTAHHFHKCGRCGHTWGHGAENNGNAAAHTCPKCGAGPWYEQVAAQTLQATAPLGSFQPTANLGLNITRNLHIGRTVTQSGCPNGVCPTRPSGWFPRR